MPLISFMTVVQGIGLEIKVCLMSLPLLCLLCGSGIKGVGVSALFPQELTGWRWEKWAQTSAKTI